MRRRAQNIVTILAMVLTLAALPTANVYADCSSTNAATNQVLQGVGNTSGSCDGSGVTKAAALAVNILSIIAGIAAIIMIILAGFKYITSGGDSNKVANAKGTLIYALIGVAIAALAQFLVHFVLNRTGTL